MAFFLGFLIVFDFVGAGDRCLDVVFLMKQRLDKTNRLILLSEFTTFRCSIPDLTKT
jgi:hypothetical protein